MAFGDRVCLFLKERDMRKAGLVGLALGLLILAGGCSLSPEEKVAREQSLKQTVDNFTALATQGDFNGIYGMTDGNFDSADSLKTNLMKSWVQDATLTGGQIASMAWINDSTAKVKLNWIFQAQSVQSHSSETFIWSFKGSTWKFKGRSLR